MLKRIIAKIFYVIINSYSYLEIASKNKANPSKFRSLGNTVSFPQQLTIINPQYISIGNNFSALYNLRLEAWDNYGGEKFTPEIIIGNDVFMNTDVHIGCINKVVIGNNVLMASRIYISDHSHGEITFEALSVAPALRPLISKGPVIIEDNVWIGEGVSILPGVTIGKNAIIGTNAVVTKDVPSNTVVGGNPARIIKHLKHIM